jgi:hypothetical protein
MSGTYLDIPSSDSKLRLYWFMSGTHLDIPSSSDITAEYQYYDSCRKISLPYQTVDMMDLVRVLE